MNIWKVIYICMDKIRTILIISIFIFIVFSCFIDVVCRYTPGLGSLGWAEEVLRYLNVWIVFLGASVAAKYSEHLKMTYALGFLNPKIRRWVENLVEITILMFLVVVIISGIYKTVQNFDQRIETLPISIAWVYLALPLGTLYMFVDMLLILINGYHPFIKSEGEKP